MKFLLDTNACVSYLRQADDSPIAKKRLTTIPGDVVICSIVCAELMYGAHRSRLKQANSVSVEKFCSQFPSLIFDDAAADIAAKVRAELAAQGAIIGPHDVMIAAIALANNLTLVTHNVGEFARVEGLSLGDWQAL